MQTFTHHAVTFLLLLLFVTVGSYAMEYDEYLRADKHVNIDQVLASQPRQDLPLTLRKQAEAIEQTSVRCLTAMLYGEARGEPFMGKVAVAYTAATRMRHSGKSMCDVVLRKSAKGVYAYTTFWYHPELLKLATGEIDEPSNMNKLDAKAWRWCQRAAKVVWHREVADPTNGADHYWSPTVAEELGTGTPAWQAEFEYTATIGTHEFYASI